jgi:hypothetical protein
LHAKKRAYNESSAPARWIIPATIAKMKLTVPSQSNSPASVPRLAEMSGSRSMYASASDGVRVGFLCVSQRRDLLDGNELRLGTPASARSRRASAREAVMSCKKPGSVTSSASGMPDAVSCLRRGSRGMVARNRRTSDDRMSVLSREV